MEDDFQLRTKEMYDQQCTAIENSVIDISSQFGINLRSALNQSRYFHVIEGLPGDAMHDVLEGLLQYEVKELLKYAIYEQQFFTLENLNCCGLKILIMVIQMFPTNHVLYQVPP